jgi:hypothetical protein
LSFKRFGEERNGRIPAAEERDCDCSEQAHAAADGREPAAASKDDLGAIPKRLSNAAIRGPNWTMRSA